MYVCVVTHLVVAASLHLSLYVVASAGFTQEKVYIDARKKTVRVTSLRFELTT